MKEKRTSKPESLHNILAGINLSIENLRKNNDFLPDEIIQNWNELLGAPIAKYTRPSKFKKGILTVSVESTIIMQEIRYSKKILLETLQKKWPFIKDIKFKISG